HRGALLLEIAAVIEPTCPQLTGHLASTLALWAVGLRRKCHDVDSDQRLLSPLEQVFRHGAGGRTKGVNEFCCAYVASLRGTAHANASLCFSCAGGERNSWRQHRREA